MFKRQSGSHRRTLQKRQDIERGTAASRGYGYQWQQYRERFVQEHPYCIACTQNPSETEVIDHILPVRQSDSDSATGVADPLFFARWNHQPLCRHHHSQKTKQHDQRLASIRDQVVQDLEIDADDSDHFIRFRLLSMIGLWTEWIDLETGEVYHS